MLKQSWTAATPIHLTIKEQKVGLKKVRLTLLFMLLWTASDNIPQTKNFNPKFNSGGNAAQLHCVCNIIIP